MPAYRIETERLVLRCYSPRDALLLQESIQESVEHLLPWMPWAASEPEDLETKILRLRSFRADFDLGRQFVFGIFNPEETKLLGGCGLHRRIGEKALEIGYWINVHHIKKGYATELARALVKVAFEIEQVNRVEIHCDPKNIASAAIPKRLGFVHEATLKDRNQDYQGNSIDTMIWTLFAEQYHVSALPNQQIKIFDEMGEIIF